MRLKDLLEALDSLLESVGDAGVPAAGLARAPLQVWHALRRDRAERKCLETAIQQTEKAFCEEADRQDLGDTVRWVRMFPQQNRPAFHRALQTLVERWDEAALEEALAEEFARVPGLEVEARRRALGLYLRLLREHLLPCERFTQVVTALSALRAEAEVESLHPKVDGLRLDVETALQRLHLLLAKSDELLAEVEQVQAQGLPAGPETLSAAPLLAEVVRLLREQVQPAGVQGRVQIQGDVRDSVIIIGEENRVVLRGKVLQALRPYLPLPGDLPPGCHLPFPRNAFFTGRKEPLRDLAQALLGDEGRVAGVVIGQALLGMGGVGKTQLAVEFAYRYGYRFRGVHWLDMADPARLEEQVAAFGREMGRRAETQEELVARTLAAWQADGPRLLVLDNLEDLRAANEVLARLCHSALRLLVTSRRRDWPPTLPLGRLPLEEFTPEESRAFLRRYLPKERTPDGDLDALAERLGHLPLALDLAARYLAQLRLTVPRYLAALEHALEHPSMQGWRPDIPNPTEHDLNLQRTFALSWEQVGEEAAQQVFRAAGHLAPNEPIPPEVLERALDLSPEACDEAIAQLQGLGLLKEGPAIHPLLAEFARALAPSTPSGQPPRAAGEEMGAVATTLADLAGETTARIDQTGDYTLFAPLLPHVRAVAGHAEAAGLEVAGRLWNTLGYHLHHIADYAGARGCLERALRIDEAAFGPDHPNVATVVNNLGRVLQDLGDLSGARGCLERALRIDEAAFGPDHPNVARDVNNLGVVLQALGDLSGARGCLERALRIDEAAFGPDHPNVAIRVNNLGSVLQDLGDLSGARGCYERALRILERHLPPDHPHIRIVRENLAGL